MNEEIVLLSVPETLTTARVVTKINHGPCALCEQNVEYEALCDRAFRIGTTVLHPECLVKMAEVLVCLTKADGRKADGDKPKPRKVLITMPWHWFPGSPIVPIPATIEELPE